MANIPDRQIAVQLTGPDELTLNTNKEVFRPGPYQILGKVETVGLCFSDLKLLKQFSNHVRKSEVKSGIDLDILEEIPSYMPGDLPTVPGHEAVITVLKIGDKVKDIEVGGKYLVQADYRWVRTATSNGAFGYNFEGALQQYNLMDQRIITSPEGESMLISVTKDRDLSNSAIALCEPWACVEDSYAVAERTEIHAGGKMLLVADSDYDSTLFSAFIGRFGKPAGITAVGGKMPDGLEGVEVVKADDIASTEDMSFDDVVYFGSNPESIELLFDKIAGNGILNIVLNGSSIGRAVEAAVGRVHYGNIRIIGTKTGDPAESMKCIPPTGEIRRGDNINVIGAAGPMGVMHVIRNLCQGVSEITVFGGDLDDSRLDKLTRVAKPVAAKNSVGFMPYNSKKDTPDVEFDYVVIMAPVPALVAGSVAACAESAIINVFAGIPADKKASLDLDTLIEKRIYLMGTSGSTNDDMKTVLSKVESGSLDTNLSVGAVCGLKAATEGIRAVENRTISGKIIVYPDCPELPLTPLDDLYRLYPDAADAMDNGVWTKQAEDKLIEIAD